MNRRDFLKSALTVAALAPAVKLNAKTGGDRELTGRVIDAATGKGMPKIRVTNGCETVFTDAEGRYKLPRHPGLKTRFVSVVIPNDRSCDKRFHPVADGGGDFVLKPRPVRKGFTFIHVGDTETAKHERCLKEIMAYARNTGAAFIVHTGDLTGIPGIKFHAEKMNTALAGRPVYYTIGNHDMKGEVYGESCWEEVFGPVHYAFEEGDALFVVFPIDHGDKRPFDKPEVPAIFIKNLLATYPKSKMVFLLSHNRAPVGFDGWFLKNSKRTADTTLTAAKSGSEEPPIGPYAINLNEWDFRGIIHGHSHLSSVKPCGKNARVWQTGMSSGGGWGNTPASFREFKISDDGKVTTELRYLYQPRQLHGVVSPEPDADGTYPVAVVAYDTIMPVKSVAAERGAEKIELRRQGPMLWCGAFKTASDAPLKTVATFADGSVLDKENAPLVNKRLKLRRMIPLKAETRFGVPVTDGSRIFVTTIDDHNGVNGGLTAFDAATGRMLWDYAPGCGVRNSAALDGGEIAVAADGGRVVLFDAATGKIKWSIEPEFPSYPFLSPLISGDTVYAPVDKTPAAISRADGKIKWRNEESGDRFGSTSPFLLSNGRLIAAVNWGFVYSIDAATGKTMWKSERQTTRPPFLLQPTTALLPTGEILVSASKFVVALDPKTGKINREGDTKARGATVCAPVVSGDMTFFGTPGWGLVALDTNKLKLQWQTMKTMGLSKLATVQYNPGGVNTVEAAPYPRGKEVYCAHTCGKLYRLSRKSGKVLEYLDLGAPLLSSPVKLGKNQLMLNDFAGRLFIFDFVIPK